MRQRLTYLKKRRAKMAERKGKEKEKEVVAEEGGK